VVYATPMELVGGEHDGAIVLPGFSLDVQAVQNVFERVTSAPVACARPRSRRRRRSPSRD
jgi:hypothetical protein